jgi:hypothetical protein
MAENSSYPLCGWTLTQLVRIELKEKSIVSQIYNVIYSSVKGITGNTLVKDPDFMLTLMGI